MIFRPLLNLLSLTLLVTSLASAQEQTPPPANSTQEIENPLIQKLRPERITYFSIFTGPALGGQGDPVDELGNVDEGSLNSWNQVSLQWQADEQTRFVINPRFSINFNGAENPPLEWEDPVFGIAGTWFEYGNLSFGGGLNSIVPMARTEGTREDGLLFNPGGFNALNYRLGPHLSVGSWIWGRYMLYEQSNEQKGNRFEYLLAPIVTYDANDRWGISTFYQMNGALDDRHRFNPDQDESLNLMLTLNINQALTLQPMITMFQANNFRLDESNFNLWISGRFF